MEIHLVKLPFYQNNRSCPKTKSYIWTILRLFEFAHANEFEGWNDSFKVNVQAYLLILSNLAILKRIGAITKSSWYSHLISQKLDDKVKNKILKHFPYQLDRDFWNMWQEQKIKVKEKVKQMSCFVRKFYGLHFTISNMYRL